MPGWQEFVVDPLADLLQAIAAGVGGYGMAVILFTLAIRIVIFPLTLKQMRMQARMQDLQPKIAAIKNVAKGDRQKESQMTMELYKKESVNPLSGCFPMLIQMPILLGLYGGLLTLSQCLTPAGLRMEPQPVGGFPDCVSAGGHMLMDERFLWFNMADIDRTLPLLLPIELPYLSFISVLALLAGAVQWVQTLMMAPVAAQGSQATMMRVMQFMPIMIVIFAWNFFSGIVLYWVVSGVIGIIQQFFTTGLGKLERFLPQPARLAAVRLGAGKLATARMSKEQLEAATADAEAALGVDGRSDSLRPRTKVRRRRRRRG